VTAAEKTAPLATVADRVRAARSEGRRIVLANGVFDLLHVGHVRYLEAAKSLGDMLVVAVNSDASTRVCKGEGHPLVPERERAELVGALGCVDWVIVFDEPDVRNVLRALRPHVHAKGTDYTALTVPERAEVESWGGEVAIVGDSKVHSSTELRQRLTKRGGGSP
jgi:rfaE bifunctional protein nucleotidyltransferase chain/domain